MSSVNLDLNTFEKFPQQDEEPGYDELFGSLCPEIEAEIFATTQLSNEEPFFPLQSFSNSSEPSILTSVAEPIRIAQTQNSASSAAPQTFSNDPISNSFPLVELSELPEINVFQNLEALLFATGGNNVMASRFTEIQEDILAVQTGQASSNRVSIYVHTFLLK
jgi:hypothetical protein